jgi:hypothetical protein
MRFRGGEFSTGTMGNFQPELTKECKITQNGEIPREINCTLPLPYIALRDEEASRAGR